MILGEAMVASAFSASNAFCAPTGISICACLPATNGARKALFAWKASDRGPALRRPASGSLDLHFGEPISFELIESRVDPLRGPVALKYAVPYFGEREPGRRPLQRAQDVVGYGKEAPGLWSISRGEETTDAPVLVVTKQGDSGPVTRTYHLLFRVGEGWVIADNLIPSINFVIIYILRRLE
jgi:hypothetical protein